MEWIEIRDIGNPTPFKHNEDVKIKIDDSKLSNGAGLGVYSLSAMSIYLCKSQVRNHQAILGPSPISSQDSHAATFSKIAAAALV